jgi:hypothetical protein
MKEEMIMYYRWFVFFALLILSGRHGNGNGTMVHVTADFESGSIGQVKIISDSEPELSLANDNHNPELPKRWQTGGMYEWIISPFCNRFGFG